MHGTPLLHVLALAIVALSPPSESQASLGVDNCQAALAKAAGKYVACQQKLQGKVLGNKPHDLFVEASKCRTTYARVWTTLQSRASGDGSPCDNPRFADLGDGTVLDRLTELQWEQKTADASVHDRDNLYPWTGATTPADGTVFTAFLATLNTPPCFAGHCDWRLPNFYELQTLLATPYPCPVSPCVDPALGPSSTVTAFYWSSMTKVDWPTTAWDVLFSDGSVSWSPKTFSLAARAVRGGR